MSFEVVLKKSAEKFILQVDKRRRAKIIELLEELKLNPLPFKHYDLIKLKGFRNFYRIRLGKIRVVYEVDFDSKTLTVWNIDYRERIYK